MDTGRPTPTTTTQPAAPPAPPVLIRPGHEGTPADEAAARAASTTGPARVDHGEDGSMVAEYGLVAVLGATIVGIVIAWAKGGAVVGLLTAVLQQLRGVVAA